jgi:hypothetical protein
LGNIPSFPFGIKTPNGFFSFLFLFPFGQQSLLVFIRLNSCFLCLEHSLNYSGNTFPFFKKSFLSLFPALCSDIVPFRFSFSFSLFIPVSIGSFHNFSNLFSSSHFDLERNSSLVSFYSKQTLGVLYFLLFFPLRFLFFFQFKLGFGSVFFFSPSLSLLSSSIIKSLFSFGPIFFFFVDNRFNLLKLIHLFNGNLFSKKSNLSFAK